MPRKQRFKPSRKPKDQVANVSNPQVDERREQHPPDADIERDSQPSERTTSIEDAEAMQSERG